MNLRIAAVIFAFCSLMPLGVAQATSADIDLLPGVSLHLGDRDQRGNYWDGYDWRDQNWWQKNYYSHGGKYYRYDHKNKYKHHDRGNHYGHYKKHDRHDHDDRGHGHGHH